MSDILERDPKSFDRLIKYGESPRHIAELRTPQGDGPFPLLFVIHGGFWQNMYDLSHISHLCAALTRKGIVTCSLEYRRVGDAGGGWPGTFLDLVQATDKVTEKMRSDESVDINRTAVVGHSAGGHLALWLTSSHRVPKESVLHNRSMHHLTKAVSLAGVCDLREAWKQRLGNGAVAKLMGGSPKEYSDRYKAASPIELLPTRTKQVLVHGTEDNIVPISQSESFAERAEQLGDDPNLLKLDGIGHFELIDPESVAWSSVAGALLPLLGLA